MKNKYFLGIIILMIVILGAILAFSINSPINDLNGSSNSTIAIENNSIDQNSLKNVELTISAEESFPVERMVEEFKTHLYYEGYDEDTVKWLETLNGNIMFTSKDYFVVMNKMDASKLPTSMVTDAFIYDRFTCDIIEKHSLGKDFKDIIYVKNVKFENQWTEPMIV